MEAFDGIEGLIGDMRNHDISYAEFFGYHEHILHRIYGDDILLNCALSNDDQNLAVHVYDQLDDSDKERVLELFVHEGYVNYLLLIDELSNNTAKYKALYGGEAYSRVYDSDDCIPVIKGLLKYCTNLDDFKKDEDLKIFNRKIEKVLIDKKVGFDEISSQWFNRFGYNTTPVSMYIFSELITEKYHLHVYKEKFKEMFSFDSKLIVPGLDDFS